MNISPYIYIWLFVILSAGITTFIYFMSLIRTKRSSSIDKNTAYECGFDSLHEAELPFSIRFYIIAVLFIIFYLGLVFLFPWAIAFDTIGLYGWLSILTFLGFLIAGFVYKWKKGALDWI